MESASQKLTAGPAMASSLLGPGPQQTSHWLALLQMFLLLARGSACLWAWPAFLSLATLTLLPRAVVSGLSCLLVHPACAFLTGNQETESRSEEVTQLGHQALRLNFVVAVGSLGL